ncbi:MAG: hypothetical protein ACRCXB_15280 [Aeromonadaceae bacterium]
MMNRETLKDKAPGNLVRKLEQATGIEATLERNGGQCHAVFGDVELSITYTNQSTRFTVITTPDFLRGCKPVSDFLTSHSVHGIVSGYRIDKGEITQWFDIMPRFAEAFAATVAQAAQEGVRGPWVCDGSPELPEALRGLVVASDWKVQERAYHPALAHPGPVKVLTHPVSSTRVIISDAGIYVGVWFPFEKSQISKVVQLLPETRCLVDRGCNGWVSGHNSDYGADQGIMYARWTMNMTSLVSRLRSVRGKVAVKVQEFDKALPKPTHYSNTIH